MAVGVITSIIVLYFGNKKYKKENPDLFPPKISAPLSLRLRNAASANNFSINSIYMISAVIGASFIIGIMYLDFKALNLLNISFAFIVTLFTLLLLNELLPHAIRKHISTIWRFALTLSLLFIPAYLMFASGFTFILICSFALSAVLFFLLTNAFMSLGLTMLVSSVAYFISTFTSGTPVPVDFGYYSCFAVAIAILMQVYNTKFIAKDVFKEVTSRLEEKVGDRTQTLKEALSIKSDFLKNLNHEMRTPIQGLLGMSDGTLAMWSKLSDEQKKESFQVVLDSGDRLKNYAFNILDIAAIRQANFELDIKENVDLVEIAKTQVAKAESMIITGNKKLEIKLKASEAKIDCDIARMAQVILNLLENAVKYSKQGTIEVSIKNKEKFVEMQISDEGIGVPDGEKDKIFEEFFEGRRTKSPAGGKGLGLTITREILYLHHGTINVEDNVPQGTKFIIRLPYKYDKSATAFSAIRNA